MSDRNINAATRVPDAHEQLQPAAESRHFVSDRTQGLRLAPAHGRLNWRFLDLPAGSYTLGSGPDCDVVLSLEGIARRHCTLIVGSHRTLVKAWSPRTWVNDGVISEGALRIGDRLILGPLELLVSASPAHSFPAHSFPAQSEAKNLQANEPSGLPEEELQTLLASGKNSQSTSGLETRATARRTEQLQELLQEVETSLSELLSREHATREEFSRERMVLSHRAQELQQQWELIEKTRHRLKAEETQAARNSEFTSRIEQQERELASLKSLLDERHAELAGRARQMVSVHRRLKNWEQQLQQSTTAQKLQVEDGQKAALRLIAARNEAQSRQLALRQQELERREESIHLQFEEIAINRMQLLEQTHLLEEQQRQWNTRCKTRERFLNDFEASLTARIRQVESEEEQFRRRSQELDQERRTLAERGQKITGRQQEIDAAHQLIEQQRQENVLENSRLEDRERQLAAQQSLLDEQTSRLQALQSTLSTRQQEMDARAVEVASGESELQLRRQECHQSELELNQQRAELEEANRLFEERQSEIDQISSSLDLRQSAYHQREESFVSREQQLEKIREELSLQAEQLETEKAELVARQEQMNLSTFRMEELETSQAGQNAERDRLEALRRELDVERQSLEQDREKSQNESSELAAELLNLARLKNELEAERQRDIYDRDQLQQTRLQLDRQRAELAEREQALTDLRNETERQQAEWKFQQASQLEAAQQSSASEADNVSNALDMLHQEQSLLTQQQEQFQAAQRHLIEERDALERRQHQVDSVAEKLHSEQESLVALREEIAMGRKELAARQQELEESRQQLQADLEHLHNRREELRIQEEAFQARCDVVAHESVPEEADPLETAEQLPLQIEIEAKGTEEPADTDSRKAPQNEDEAAVQLRHQLANLFGIKSPADGETGKESDENSASWKQDAEEPAHEERYEQQDDSGIMTPPHAVDSPASSEREQHCSDFTGGRNEAIGDGTDDSIAAYMERLLARNRQANADRSSSAVQSSYLPLDPKPAPLPTIDQSQVSMAESESPPLRKPRKMDEAEKKSIRSNLHSFREVANQSARTAVAKSKRTQKSSSLRTMGLLNSVGWITAILLVIAEPWLDISMRREAIVVAGISLFLTGLCLYRYKEIRRLSLAAPSMAEKEADHADDVDVTEDLGEKSGPLSFL